MEPDLDDTVGPLSRERRPAAGGSDAPAPRPGDTAPMPEPLLAAADTPNYGFRIGESGRTVLLDAVAYVGRAPSSPRIQHGRLPRLIRVPSPRGEVSGTHLEVRQLGGSVVVTDLKSTNGSRVRVPGRESRALRQGESMVVTPGTLVDIGDGIVVEILPLQRRIPAPHAPYGMPDTTEHE